MAIGPDHTYPLGSPINRNDRGGLYAGFSVNKRLRLGIMQFGTVLSWLSSPPSEMITLAQTIRRMIHKEFGMLPYDKSTLPLKVVGNETVGVVEIYLPQPVETLAANPEMWLALSDVVEAAAKQMTH